MPFRGVARRGMGTWHGHVGCMAWHIQRKRKQVLITAEYKRQDDGHADGIDWRGMRIQVDMEGKGADVCCLLLFERYLFS